MRVRYALAAFLASMLGAFAPGAIPVLAGSNGQEIEYFEACGNSFWSETWGYNQKGEEEDHFYYTPPNQSDPQCFATNTYQDAGWWWVGTVYVNGWQSYDGNQGSGADGTEACDVPQSQQDNDWTDCQVPG